MKKKRSTQNDTKNDETKRRCIEDKEGQAKKEKKQKTGRERDCLPAERQGDVAIPCPGTKRRQKRRVKGDGRWVWNKQWQAHQHKDFTLQYLSGWDGKLASAQDGTPSRGEPGEPRRFNTYQRTPGPKLGGKRDTIKGNGTRRERNQKRGIRNEATTERRERNRNRHRGANRKMYREISNKKQGRLAEDGNRSQANHNTAPKSAYKGYHNEQKCAPNKISKTRAGIIRSTNRTQRIPNKDNDPDNNNMKWRYGETIKVASINVRGMEDPVNREEIITQMEANGIHIMCLQGTKIRDSCYKVRKGYTFVFPSTSTDREHWGVGLCYKNYIEKYRNYYRQVSSNMIAMELNMHGNPLIIASVYTPHENTNDERKRQRAWEDLPDFVTETSEAIITQY